MFHHFITVNESISYIHRTETDRFVFLSLSFSIPPYIPATHQTTRAERHQHEQHWSKNHELNVTFTHNWESGNKQKVKCLRFSQHFCPLTTDRSTHVSVAHQVLNAIWHVIQNARVEYKLDIKLYISSPTNTLTIRSGMTKHFFWKCQWPVSLIYILLAFFSILHSNYILQSVTTIIVLFQNEAFSFL